MSSESLPPVNALEQAMHSAAHDPGARPAFYNMLLENEIYFLTPEPPVQTGEKVLAENTEVGFVSWHGQNGDYIPAFSSFERLQEAVNKFGGDYGYLRLNTRTAFDMLTQNSAPLLLNPGCPFGKEFLIEEMRSLVDGSFFRPNQTVVKGATKILLGQPAVYPGKLVEALKTLFAQHPSVLAAYMAQVHYEASSDPPHILIGIECPGSMPVIAPQAVAVSREIYHGGQIVDYIELGPRENSVNNYFRTKTQPFYSRGAKPRWKFW